MATNPDVFKKWIERKLKRHPMARELKVPYNIARHMPNCTCPKPTDRRQHDGWNSSEGSRLPVGHQEFKNQHTFKIFNRWSVNNGRTWMCFKCVATVYIGGEEK